MASASEPSSSAICANASNCAHRGAQWSRRLCARDTEIGRPSSWAIIAHGSVVAFVKGVVYLPDIFKLLRYTWRAEGKPNEPASHLSPPRAEKAAIINVICPCLPACLLPTCAGVHRITRLDWLYSMRRPKNKRNVFSLDCAVETERVDLTSTQQLASGVIPALAGR